jgi:hypothetical protein
MAAGHTLIQVANQRDDHDGSRDALEAQKRDGAEQGENAEPPPRRDDAACRTTAVAEHNDGCSVQGGDDDEPDQLVELRPGDVGRPDRQDGTDWIDPLEIDAGPLRERLSRDGPASVQGQVALDGAVDDVGQQAEQIDGVHNDEAPEQRARALEVLALRE